MCVSPPLNVAYATDKEQIMNDNSDVIEALSVGEDKPSKDFTRVMWSTSPVVNEGGDDFLSQSVDSLRWSFTYGGDCSLEHTMYRGLLTAFLSGLKDVTTMIVTIQQAATGEVYAFQCYVPAGGVKVQGADWSAGEGEPHVMLTQYFPDTDSVSLTQVKVYLYQIINIHIP